MTMSAAWLLECGDSLALAVGDHEMVEYAQQGKTWTVPGAPGYCSSVMVWQNRIVPIMNLRALQGGPAETGEKPHVCVLNYQEAPGLPLQQLAVCVTRAPQKIRVEDEQACEFPPSLEPGKLREVTLACFAHDGLPVLIVDIARLCSAEFRELANAA
jgi:chemotaxis signal transduction protein